MQAGGLWSVQKKIQPLSIYDVFHFGVRVWREKKSSAVYQNNGENWWSAWLAVWLAAGWKTLLQFVILFMTTTKRENSLSSRAFTGTAFAVVERKYTKNMTVQIWVSSYREDWKWLAVMEKNLPRRVQSSIDTLDGNFASIVSYYGAIWVTCVDLKRNMYRDFNFKSSQIPGAWLYVMS